MTLAQKGYLTINELKASTVYPSEERMKQGPLAVIECIQEIPCNPCEGACKKKAIKLGTPITNLPEIDLDKCTGCGLCAAQCPGLAIFIIDKSYSGEAGTVAFPHEYYPLPEVGQAVSAVNRSGSVVCQGTVKKIMNPKSNDRTPIITLEVPINMVEEVRGISRKEEPAFMADDMLVCRCEEVTVGEIKEAIRQGARDVTGVKRRTRAGMGLCQGRTCEKLVQQILKQELGSVPEEIGSGTSRPPVRPVTFGSLGGGELCE